MKKNSVRILSVIVVFLFLFTTYSVITRPLNVAEGMPPFQQQAYFGSTSQISNGTMVLSAYGDNETLLLYSDGFFAPYYKSSENSTLHGDYYRNISGYMGHIVGAYDLYIGKESQNISEPGAGITFSVSDVSMETNNSFVYIPLEVSYPNTTNGHPQFRKQTYVWISDFPSGYPILSSFPVNQTLQIWVNFTITPIVELGPYYLPGSSTHVSITWNLIFINKN